MAEYTIEVLDGLDKQFQPKRNGMEKEQAAMP